MAQVIGFAGTFYTLWDVRKDEVYYTAPNGKHYLTGYTYYYTYLRNISTDLDKAKSLYPDLGIDEGLKGKTQSWVSENKEDLCPHIMKFGKYAGLDVADILNRDFQYLVWLCINGSYSANRQYVSQLPEIITYFEQVEQDLVAAGQARRKTFDDLVEAGVYEFEVERNLGVGENTGRAFISKEINDVYIYFEFPAGHFAIMSYNGFYYGLPLINGKAKRIKGKRIRLSFEKHPDEDFTVIVDSIKIL